MHVENVIIPQTLYNIVSLQASEKKIAIDIIIDEQVRKETFMLDGMRISSIL